MNLSAEDKFIELTGVPVSINEKEKYPLANIKLNKGDLMLFFTDGLVEARYNGNLFGEERVRQYIQKNNRGMACRAPTLNQLIKGLVAEAERFSHNNLTDDVLVLGIKKK